MIIHNMEQRSPEWFAIRRGKITASEASKVITPTGKRSTQFQKLLPSILCEKHGLNAEISALAEEWGMRDPYGDWDTVWTRRGRELEAQALAWFRLETGFEVTKVGFVEFNEYVGMSPDGMVGKVPLELKCPAPETHLSYLMDKGLPSEHAPQVHAQIGLMDAPHGWFMSYCPGMKPLLLKVERNAMSEQAAEWMLEAGETLAALEREHFTGD